ncbi:hypothetical protein [Cardinium endosymbiont of Dermatophagoides farinae]|nr:hypothetical protein [Cardinium endosymbiont of Dermatophagoides farinae]
MINTYDSINNRSLLQPICDQQVLEAAQLPAYSIDWRRIGRL